VTVKLFPLQTLIELGAVELVVPGVLPIGCFPLYLTLYPSWNKDDYDEIGCLKSFNNLSGYHNDLLKQAVSGLQSKHAGVRLIYADFYAQVADMVRSPENFGTYVRRRRHPIASFHTCTAHIAAGRVPRVHRWNEPRMHTSSRSCRSEACMQCRPELSKLK
jgi:hypothetical protein